MTEFGLERSSPWPTRSCAHGRAMRQAIRALKPGVYTNEVTSDGFDEPIIIRARWRDSRRRAAGGLRRLVAGEPARRERVMNYTEAYTTTA